MRFLLWSLVSAVPCSTAAAACNDATGSGDGSDAGPRETPALAEAGTGGGAPSADAAPPALEPWSAVFDDLDAPVLSVWGTSAERAFFVGEGGLVLERDGSRWFRWSVPTGEALWWVWGRAEDDVYAGGEAGTLLHFDGTDWSRVPTGLDADDTIWGIWGSGETVWLVGGRARTNGPGFLIEGNADGFGRSQHEGLPNLYKIWGTSREDIWVVGDRSSLYQLDAGELVEQDLGPAGDSVEPLFTVSGQAGALLAVGGIGQGLAFERSAEGFASIPFATAGLNGVSVGPAGEVVVVGLFGVIRERQRDQWIESDLELERHYHATAAFEDGAYAVGGDLLASGDERRGLIVARGAAVARDVRLEQRRPVAASDAGVDAGPGGGAPRDAASAGEDSGTHRDADVDTPREAGLEAGPGPAPDAAPRFPVEDECEPTCTGDSECWYIQGEKEYRCVLPCVDATECSAELGEGWRCAPPGCQTTLTHCLGAEWRGCVL